jgi:ribosomal protein L37AE/L43A
MSFDDIPEDLYESYPCPREGCTGSVQLSDISGKWECSKCDWEAENDR